VQPQNKPVCSVTGRELLNNWVTAGYTETLPFIFRDINGNICQATFANVIALFNQADLWYTGALACDACHNADITVAAAGLDLSSYAGILAGSHRTTSTSQGEDILGEGNWARSLLNQQLFVYQLMPFGAPSGTLSPTGPTIQAGVLLSIPTEVPTDVPGLEEVARPHTPGGPGEAINLTGDPLAGQKVFIDHCQICHGIAGTDNVLNPGSDDGTVPPLNPIDATLLDPDPKTFAYNLDLFLQNGSVAEGPNAALQMPAWGADGGLTQQQIADVTAYLIALNQ
jgi:mono/diheme cytochrome c family protein